MAKRETVGLNDTSELIADADNSFERQAQLERKYLDSFLDQKFEVTIDIVSMSLMQKVNIDFTRTVIHSWRTSSR